jgi:hypothetical protein
VVLTPNYSIEQIEQESDVSDESSAKESDDKPGSDENDLQQAPIPTLPSNDTSPEVYITTSSTTLLEIQWE